MQIFFLDGEFGNKKILKNKTVLEFSLKNYKNGKIIKQTELSNFLNEEVCIFFDSVIIFKGFEFKVGQENEILFFDEKNNIVGLYLKSFSNIDLKNISENNFENYKKIILKNIEKITDEASYRYLISDVGLKDYKNAYIYCPHATILADKFYNYISFFLVRKILPYNITPNQITIISFVISIIGSGIIFFSSNIYIIVIGVILWHVSFIFDCMDGGLARIKRLGSKFGGFLDSGLDSAKMGMMLLSIFYFFFLQNNTLLLYLLFIFVVIKYLNSILYNTATYFVGTMSTNNFSSKVGFMARLANKLGLRPEQLIMSDDVLLVLFSIGIIFNCFIYILPILIIYYFLQYIVFFYVTLRFLKNEMK